MVSHERTYLTKLREKGKSEPESTLQHLDTLVQQYPYFQALHHLRWQISHNQNFKETEGLLKKASLHTKNRLHLIPNPEVAQETVHSTKGHDTSNEVRSFAEWLQHLEGTQAPQKTEDRLIDKFIADAPKILVSKSVEIHQDLTKKQQFDEQTLMTETLAQVYLKQGKLKKAKKAYEILALKYPKKSGFFADQILKITNAQNEN